MNPIQQLAKLRSTAKQVHENYSMLHDELCNIADLLNELEVPLQLPWSQGELVLAEPSCAIVRWRPHGFTVISVAVGQFGRTWGFGYPTDEPRYEKHTQLTPPPAWIDFVRIIYP